MVEECVTLKVSVCLDIIVTLESVNVREYFENRITWLTNDLDSAWSLNISFSISVISISFPFSDLYLKRVSCRDSGKRMCRDQTLLKVVPLFLIQRMKKQTLMREFLSLIHTKIQSDPCLRSLT